MPSPTAPSANAEGRAEPRSDDPPVREVVVGVDGTECGLGAVRWAAQEAARRDAPLRILHAAPYLGRRTTPGAAALELAAARKITAQAYTVARHTEPGVRTSTEIVPSDPTPTLLRAAVDGQLVVLGSSTTGAADEWVNASVAVHVAARSPQPVVVVPRQRSSSPVSRPVAAVLGVGDPENDERVVTFAATAAERAGTPLAVLQTRAAGGHAPLVWLQDPEEWERRFPGLEVRRTDLPGASASQVLTATAPSPLIVLSAGHGTLLHRGLDGPHRWLLRHCTSPMALVPTVHRRSEEPLAVILSLG
jgi:nucleotide-binding universal stress UspA family protein